VPIHPINYQLPTSNYELLHVDLMPTGGSNACPMVKPGYVVLARKYRPRRFADLVGQPHIVAALSNAILTNRVAQAFLLTGSRGTGKTTTARLLACALNCQRRKEKEFEPCGECRRSDATASAGADGTCDTGNGACGATDAQ
jgi:hypothetical protein